MTTNTINKQSTMDHFTYPSVSDSGSSKPRRIGTSATEIELLDDIPLSFGAPTTNSPQNFTDRPRVFDAEVSRQRKPLASPDDFQSSFTNVGYSSLNNQDLTSAVDRLLERYAPDATPGHFSHSETSRQTNVVVTHEEPFKSRFPTSEAPPSSATHQYSTIVRPGTTGPPAPSAVNQNPVNITNPPNRPATMRTEARGLYDSIQHVLPSTHQTSVPNANPPPPPRSTIPTVQQNGKTSQVIPGVLYTLDDPLPLFYDRQDAPLKRSTVPTSTPQFSFVSTFQPAPPTTIVQDPLAMMFDRAPTSSRPPSLQQQQQQQQQHQEQYSSQRAPPTSNANSMGMPAVDLARLIKSFQEDYRREIQPFVASVKFVEKDREYGQSLADVGFITPVSVRKGFRKQADDILRRSFGRQNNQPPPPMSTRNPYEFDADDTDDDDRLSDLPSSPQRAPPLGHQSSKQSFSSLTSVSSSATDYDVEDDDQQDHYRKRFYDQTTSPPPVNKNPPAVAEAKSNPSPVSRKSANEPKPPSETPTRPIVPTPARRIPTDERSNSSTESPITSDDENDEKSVKYNEHDQPVQPNPSQAIGAFASVVPVVKPDENVVRQRANETNSAIQRSEDIKPIPPIIGAGQSTSNPTGNNQRAPIPSDSDTIVESDSNAASDSEDEKKPTTQPTRSSAPTTRPGLNDISSTSPLTRSTAAPTSAVTTTPARGAPTSAATTAPAREAPTSAAATTPARGASTSAAATTPARGAYNPVASSQPATTTNTYANTRGAANTRGPENNNLSFLPSDQRATGASNAPSTAMPTNTPQQTGSNRFFNRGNESKSNRSGAAESPSSFGSRIKSLTNIFRRS